MSAEKKIRSTVWQNAPTVVEGGVEYGWIPHGEKGNFHIACRPAGSKVTPVCVYSPQFLKLSPSSRAKIDKAGVFRKPV